MTQKILVIESDPWLGDHYQRVLERHAMAVLRASNAYSAMDVIDNKIPDAIVMSLGLSGSSSIALLHELQTYTDTARIPIIICCNTNNLSLEELRPYGVHRLIDSTTMQPEDLVAQVRSMMA